MRTTAVVVAGLFSASCALAGSSAAPAPKSVVGVEVFNNLPIQVGAYLDGTLLGYVPPENKACVRVPIPNREGVLRFLSTGGGDLRDIAHTTATPFQNRTDWVVVIQRQSIAPIVPGRGGECRIDDGGGPG